METIWTAGLAGRLRIWDWLFGDSVRALGICPRAMSARRRVGSWIAAVATNAVPNAASDSVHPIVRVSR